MDLVRRTSLVAVGLLVVVLLGAVLAACGGDDSGGSSQKNQTITASNGNVTVDAFDIYFNASKINAKPGSLTVTLHNKGSLLHNFSIDNPKLKIDVAAGQTKSGTVTLEAGTYQYFCDVPGHRATMHGTLVVK